MGRAVRAAVVYFAAVFTVGFLLGALRVTVVVPRLGETAAVALETVPMLVVSWLACRRLLAAFEVPAAAMARMSMSAIAIGLLIAAELALGVWGFGRGLPELIAAWGRPAGALGLAAQLAFGLFPLLATPAARRR